MDSSNNQPYIVSARKYRPSTFRSVVGQKALTATLKNAIDSGRLAQAYLFCGPRGVGKTSCARIFAKTINCLSPTPEGEACNECESCRAFNEGRSINVVELDAASNNSVDNIRELNSQVQVPPQIGKYRVFIIDEVHMLSVAAFNAFLKTLEEPPRYVIFILATTEKHKVIPTILSRCQIYDFARITVPDIAEHLAYVASQEGVEAEPAALGVIARKADGAMRDALSIFDQVAASSMGRITYKSAIANLNVLDYEYYFRLVEAFLKGDVPQSLLIYKEVCDAGFDSLSFVAGLGAHVRDLLVAADPQTLPLLEVSDDIAERYKTQAALIKPQWAYRAMETINDCDMNYRTTTAKKFVVELSLIRLCQLINPEPAMKQAGSSSLAPISTPAPQASSAVPSAPQATPVSAAEPPQTAPVSRIVSAPAPVRQPKQVRVGATIRISNPEPAPHPEPHVEPVAAAASTPTGPVRVDEEKLAEAWREFMLDHRDRHLLVATMRNTEPKPAGDAGVYEVKVDHLTQQQVIESSMGELLESLRSATGAPALTLKITIAPQSERPRVLTSREFLDKITREYPSIAEMLRELDAEMVM